MTTRRFAILQVIACFLAPLVASAATFSGSGPGGPIPDGLALDVPGAPFVSTVTVPATFTDPISNVWLEFDGLNHTWVGDLHARLIHPDGVTSLDLFSRPGRDPDNEYGFPLVEFDAANSYSFSDNGDYLLLTDPNVRRIPSDDYRPASNPNPPDSNAFPYSYRQQYFREIFGGKSAEGVWTLEITDWAEFDDGSLDGWTLNIRPVMPGDEVYKFVSHNVAFGKQTDVSIDFGFDVAFSGNTAIIGAPFDSYDNFFAGGAHLYDLTTGQQTAILPPTNPPGAHAKFGLSVAIEGNAALVGALHDRVDVVGAGFATGAVYQYDVSDPHNPVEVRQLIPADATGDHIWEFGSSVAINGNIALIGAPQESYQHPGSAYLFDLSTGQELVHFAASDAQVADGFGAEVAIDGNMALVAAPYRGEIVHDLTGAVYVFDISDPLNPVELWKLTSADPEVFRFGDDVALYGNLALIGADFSGEDPAVSGASGEGAAYLFDVKSGQELAKLLPTDPGIYERFGSSVALHGDIAVIGATGDGFPFPQSGAIYVFDVSDPLHPVELRKIKASDATHNDLFGYSLAFDGRRILVGVPENSNVSPGSAYLFRIPEPSSLVLTLSAAIAGLASRRREQSCFGKGASRRSSTSQFLRP